MGEWERIMRNHLFQIDLASILAWIAFFEVALVLLASVCAIVWGFAVLAESRASRRQLSEAEEERETKHPRAA